VTDLAITGDRAHILLIRQGLAQMAVKSWEYVPLKTFVRLSAAQDVKIGWRR
jgi:hypothetical protein